MGQELQDAVRALLDVGRLVSLGGWSLVLAIALEPGWRRAVRISASFFLSFSGR